MKKKLLIHIGPPKTATTSFQYWLADNQENYTYIGVFQPRYSKENIVYNNFWKFFIGTLTLQELIDCINNIETKEILMLSEEMILVTNWENKISKLKELESFFDVYLSYCYRNSNKAIPSYYAEIHSTLPKKMKGDYELFVNDIRFKAYDLEYLTSIINSKLNIFTFDDLVKGNLTLNKMFKLNIDDDNFNLNIFLKKENSRVNKETNSYLVINSADPYPPALKPFLKKVEYRTNINFSYILKSLFKRNYHIKIFDSTKVNELQEKNLSFFQKYSKVSND
jgi:hypothetical protein